MGTLPSQFSEEKLKLNRLEKEMLLIKKTVVID